MSGGGGWNVAPALPDTEERLRAIPTATTTEWQDKLLADPKVFFSLSFCYVFD